MRGSFRCPILLSAASRVTLLVTMVVLALFCLHWLTQPTILAHPLLSLYTQVGHKAVPHVAHSLRNMPPKQIMSIPKTAHMERSPRSSNGMALNLDLIDIGSIPTGQPLVEIPLHWFLLPDHLLGADYVLIPLYIGDRGPLNFLVDTGLTTNLLTPQICEELNIVPQNSGVRGMASDGNVQLKTVSLNSVSINGKIQIPKFTAAVIDFPHRGYAQERNIKLDGMVGMEFLEQFDIKYEKDPVKGVDMLSVYRALEGFEAHQNLQKWKAIQGILMPARLMAVQIAVDNAPVPFLGILDSGASHTIMNHEAAKALGYNLNDPKLKYGPGVQGIGVLGQEVHMPTVPIKACLSSMPKDIQMNKDWSGRWSLTPMEHDSNCIGFEHKAVAAIGEMNFAALTSLAARGLGPYKGPLVLTGQDILTQRELLFSGAAKKMLMGDPTGRFTNA